MFKNLQKYAFTTIILFLTFFIDRAVLAKKAPDTGHPITLPGPDTNYQDYFLNTFLPYLIKMFSTIVGSFSLLFLIIGGIQYLTAYGDDEKLQTAKKTVTWSIMGLVIVILSYAIVNIITSLEFKPPA